MKSFATEYEKLARRGTQDRLVFSSRKSTDTSSAILTPEQPHEKELFVDELTLDIRHNSVRPQEELIEELTIEANDHAC